MPSGLNATPDGKRPTVIGAPMTVLVAVSITDTVLPFSLVM